MCMLRTLFTMKKDKKGEFYGIGYKYISSSMCSMGAKFRVGRWVEDKKKNEIDGYPNYAPGFHILQTLAQARKMFPSSPLYEVHFKDVVAFGTEVSTADCIIARKIKVVKKVIEGT